jgi:peroxiredoxin
VGQEIRYRQEDVRKYADEDGDKTRIHRTDTTVWVTGKNSDGTYRLVFHTKYRRDANSDEKQHQDYHFFAKCSMHDDGRYNAAQAHSTYTGREFADMFPRLPPGMKNVDVGWSSRSALDNARSEFSTIPPTDSKNTWSFREVKETALDPIYAERHTAIYHFGLESGLIDNAELKREQGWGVVSSGLESLRLVGVSVREAGWISQFDRESEIFFKADQALWTAQGASLRDLRSTEEAVAKAERVYQEVDAAIKLPESRELLKNYEKWFRDNCGYLRDDAKKFISKLDQPAAEWELTDLDGKAHKLSDYRGKILILVFWYRGCGWGIRALPELSRMKRDFLNQPIAVLGMNTDDDASDARFVVETMKIPYPVLRANDIKETYPVNGCPTFVLVDQNGIIRNLRFGYSKSLYDDMAQHIINLLPDR